MIVSVITVLKNLLCDRQDFHFVCYRQDVTKRIIRSTMPVPLRLRQIPFQMHQKVLNIRHKPLDG